MRVVSESGLYKLIMRSAKAETVDIQNWVTREVLPSIRRTGGYLLNEHARETGTKEAMPVPAAFMEVFHTACPLGSPSRHRRAAKGTRGTSPYALTSAGL